MSHSIKACWSDNTLLPSTCVLDSNDEAEIYGCVHAKDIDHRDECEHWNEELAVDLCKEILGDQYMIFRVADIDSGDFVNLCELCENKDFEEEE
ncbi:hypothetical protein UFOVP1138_20 [uncultured Caudovirales phage]|uniref:Uncharacterized protein n=1 Tax=uncultured Caudovirales phage TaxID=2100421 RepID=A0A6J5QXU6_9CAUD|nr:hypothetical protein UFOVP975_11 [uncultured Caudovirales phage]CAB4186201.1 hypothetical protein UFOVP1138_20 [uncultured Caudovirales phage]CAB4204397.1 hypothetical protein UFOVP1394_17 [uncultured Caudovirales phage]